MQDFGTGEKLLFPVICALIVFSRTFYAYKYSQRQPEIHLFAARVKEQSGDIPGARAAYQLVHSEISPGLLEAIIKHANMEHRLVRWFD